MTATRQRSLLGELLHRNVPQVLLGYMGLCWVAVEFTDFASERYSLSSQLVELVGLGLLSVLPAVLLVVWFYGAPGKDPRSKMVTYGVPLNLLATAALIYGILGDVRSDATSDQVMVTNLETGQAEAREVPKASFRRKVGVFFLDRDQTAESDSQRDWLQYGLAIMLSADLNQDMRLVIENPFHSPNSSLMRGLRQAGYQDGLAAPLPLQGSIARKLGLDFFVRGKYFARPGSTEVELSLYSVEPIINVATVSGASDDVLALVDQLTEQLKSELYESTDGNALADDLPVSAHMTESVQALEAYVSARVRLLLDNDFEGALADFESALELDPTFALAWVDYSIVQAENTNFAAAREAITNGLRHGYRLSERQVYKARGLKHYLDGEIEERIQVYELWAELYPDDVTAYLYLASAYVWSGNRLEEAKATYRRILEVDPGSDWVLRRIAKLEAGQSNYAAALALNQQYAEKHPSDTPTLISIGNMNERLGRFELAEAAYDRAALVDADAVSPVLALATLFERKGEMRAAEEHYLEAVDLANDPKSALWATRSYLDSLKRQGRIKRAYDLLGTLEDQARQVVDPREFILDIQYMNIGLVTQVEGPEVALQRVTDAAESLQPPWDAMSSLGYLYVYLEAGDATNAKPQLARLEAHTQSMGRDDLLFMINQARGLIAELEGRFEEAVTQLEAAKNAIQTSVQNAFGPEALASIEVDLGRVLMLAGRYDEAKRALERTLESIPAHAEANLRLAQLLRELGEVDAARFHLEGVEHVLSAADEDFKLLIEARALADALGSQLVVAVH